MTRTNNNGKVEFLVNGVWMTAKAARKYTAPKGLELGTVVLSNLDGEAGSILNGYAAKNGEWTSYEVTTDYGIEVWNRSEFSIMSECLADIAE